MTKDLEIDRYEIQIADGYGKEVRIQWLYDREDAEELLSLLQRAFANGARLEIKEAQIEPKQPVFETFDAPAS